MAQRTPGSIVNEGLMSLVDLHYNQKKAQLEAERASTQKSVEGRQILPGVMAQLAELRAKEQAQKEKISRQGESQGPSPQSMMPPMVEVSGRTSGRSPTQALKSASEIAQIVSGGAGIKQGMIGTIAGQQAPQQAPQQAGATQSVPTNIGQPTQTVPSGINMGQGPPGSVVQITRDLPWWEQGLYGLGAIAGRNVGLGITAIRGEEVIGTRQIPTLDQQAEPMVPGLSVLISRSRSTDQQTAQTAQAELATRRGQIEGQYGRDLADTAYRSANDQYMVKEEERRIASEDPLTKTKRDKAMLEFSIEQQVHERGLESLSSGDRAIFEGSRRSTTVNVTNQNQLERGTKVFLQKEQNESQSVMSLIDSFDDAFFAEGYNLMTPADEFQLTLKDRSGLLSADEKTRLDRYQTQRSAMAGLNANVINRYIGKQQSGKELEHLNDLILKLKNGKTRTAAAAAELREQVGLGLFRYQTILESGSMADPRYVMSLGNVKNAVRISISKHRQELQDSGLSEQDAVEQTRIDFKNRYGLDTDRMLGIR